MPILNRKISSNRSSFDAQFDKRYLYLTARYCKIPMVIQVGKIILYVLLAILVFKNQITIDKLVLLISYYEMVVLNTNKTLEELLNLTTYNIRLQRIKSILNYTSYTKGSYGDLNNDYINGDVLFDNVSFNISGREILKMFPLKPSQMKLPPLLVVQVLVRPPLSTYFIVSIQLSLAIFLSMGNQFIITLKKSTPLTSLVFFRNHLFLR